MPLVYLILALLPAVFWFYYFWEKDDLQLPTDTIFFALSAGAISCFPVGTYYAIFENQFSNFDNIHQEAFTIAFFAAALPEEIVKLAAVWFVYQQRKPFVHSPYDLVIIGASVAAGFAATENLLYIVNNMENYGIVATSRSLTAVPGHIFYGVVMGALLTAFKAPKLSTKYLPLALALPVLLHTAYDYFVFLRELSKTGNLIEIAEIGIVGLLCIEGIIAIWLAARVVNIRQYSGSERLSLHNGNLVANWRHYRQFRKHMWWIPITVLAISIIWGSITLIVNLHIVVLPNAVNELAWHGIKTTTTSGAIAYAVFHCVAFYKHQQEIKIS
jgi:protease PrsW